MKFWIIVLSAWGCAQQEFDDQRSRDRSASQSKVECRHDQDTGCLMGHVLAAPDLRFGSQRFDDAESFFASVPQKAEQLLGLSFAEEKIDWDIQPVNRDFGDDFEIYIKGPEASTLLSQSEGRFAAHQLLPGRYRLVAKKTYRLQREYANVRSVDEAPRPVLQDVCLHLRHESDVDIDANIRTVGLLLDRFAYDIKFCESTRK